VVVVVELVVMTTSLLQTTILLEAVVVAVDNLWVLVVQEIALVVVLDVIVHLLTVVQEL
jgi:hypothetical protein